MTNKKSHLEISPSFDEFFAKRLKQIEDQGKADQKKIAAFRGERKKLDEEIKERLGVVSKQDVEYLLLVAEREHTVEEKLDDSRKIQLGFEAGKITADDYSKHYHSESKIRHAEREAFSKEISLTAAAIRKLKTELKELVKSAWTKRRDEVFLRQRSFDNKYQLVKKAAEELDKFRSPNMEAESIAQKLKDLDLDFPQGHSFSCESLDDLELLALEPVVLPEHTGELYKYIDRVRESGFDFKKNRIEASYTRAPLAPYGTDSGFNFQAIRREVEKLSIVTSGDLK